MKDQQGQNVALYVRVSTDEQQTDQQRHQLERWVEARGWNVVATFEDVESGGTAVRPALQRMMEKAHRREFEIVAIWALDRLSREGILAMHGHVDRLAAAGVRLVSLQESWLDTAGPTADLLLSIFAWVAKQERDRLSDRTKAGMERARRQGKEVGRPAAQLDEVRLVELFRQGHTIRSVAEQIGASKSAVSRRLAVLRERGVDLSRKGGSPEALPGVVG